MKKNKYILASKINTIKSKIANMLSDKQYLQEKIKHKLSRDFQIHDIPKNLYNEIEKNINLDQINKKELSYDVSMKLDDILNDSTNEEFISKYIEKDDIQKLILASIENLGKDEFNFNERNDHTINFTLNNLTDVLIKILYENYYLIYTKPDFGLTTNINDRSISEYNQHIEKNEIYSTETISSKPMGLNKLLELNAYTTHESKLRYYDIKDKNDKSYKFNKNSIYQYKVVQEIHKKNKVYTYNTIYPIIENSESNFSLNKKLYLREFTDTKIAINFDLPINELISHIELIKKDYDNGLGIKSIFELLGESTIKSNLFKLSKNKSWADKLFIYDYIQKRNITKVILEEYDEMDYKEDIINSKITPKSLKFKELAIISELAEILNNNKIPKKNSILNFIIEDEENYDEKKIETIRKELNKQSDAIRKHYDDISKTIVNAEYKQIIRGKNNITPIIKDNFYDFILGKLKENLTHNN